MFDENDSNENGDRAHPICLPDTTTAHAVDFCDVDGNIFPLKMPCWEQKWILKKLLGSLKSERIAKIFVKNPPKSHKKPTKINIMFITLLWFYLIFVDFFAILEDFSQK